MFVQCESQEAQLWLLELINEQATKYRWQLKEYTHGQSENPSWVQVRMGAVTGSSAKQVMSYKYNSNSEPVQLTSSLIGYKSTELKLPAITWGKQHENDALRAFKNGPMTLHENAIIRACGIYVYP